MKKIDPRIYDFIRTNGHLAEEEIMLHLQVQGYKNGLGNDISLHNVRTWRQKVLS